MPNISAGREVPIDVIVQHSSHERASARLLQMLLGHDQSPLGQLKKSIDKAVQAFSAATSHADDLTLLLVRYSETTESDRPIASVATTGHVTRGKP